MSVSPSQANVLMGGTQQFTPTVTGTSNTGVTWSVNGTAGGNATVGTISAAGMYTAPTTVPASTVTITATSQADSSKSGSATVTVTSNIAVSVAPASVTLVTNGTQQFTATITGTSNTGVTWSATAGAISASGFYTAPASVPNPATVTVRATSMVDPGKSGTATVTITAAGTQPMLDWLQMFSTNGQVGTLGPVVVDSNDNIIAGGSRFNTTINDEVFTAFSYTPSGAQRWAFNYGATASFPWGAIRKAGTDNAFFFGRVGSVTTTSAAWLLELNAQGTSSSDVNCQVAGQLTVATAAAYFNNVLYMGVIAPNPQILSGGLGSNPCSGAISARSTGRLTGILAAQGYFLVAGDFSGGGTFNVTGYLRKIDTSGNLQWQAEKTFPDVRDLRVLEDQGSIYISGTLLVTNSIKFWLTKLDQNGNVLWTRTWDGGNGASSYNNVAFQLLKNPKGGVVVVGQLTELGSSNVNIWDAGAWAVDASGNTLWTLRKDFQGADVCHGGVFDSAGKLIIVGAANNGASFAIAKYTTP